MCLRIGGNERSPPLREPPRERYVGLAESGGPGGLASSLCRKTLLIGGKSTDRHCGKLTVPAVVAPATYGPAVALIPVDGSMEGFCNPYLTVPAGTPRMRPIAAQLLPSSRSLAASSRRKTRRGRPQCLPAAGAFFTPATTLRTIIPRSSSLKADITEIMNRPIGEPSSVLSPWEVAIHATP